MSFVAGSIHGHGFARIFATGNFCRQFLAAREHQGAGPRCWSKRLSPSSTRRWSGKAWVAGEYSVADAVLFYVEFWADKTEIDLPPNVLRHYRAMLERPAVSRVLREEGYRPEKLGQRAEM